MVSLCFALRTATPIEFEGLALGRAATLKLVVNLHMQAIWASVVRDSKNHSQNHGHITRASLMDFLKPCTTTGMNCHLSSGAGQQRGWFCKSSVLVLHQKTSSFNHTTLLVVRAPQKSHGTHQERTSVSSCNFPASRSLQREHLRGSTTQGTQPNSLDTRTENLRIFFALKYSFGASRNLTIFQLVRNLHERPEQ